ncbi:MAG: restriction endonuclease subunit S [Bacteroidales bacterium]|nr:restriction endonuclease subunit S [Bacteroidales bacterium]
MTINNQIPSTWEIVKLGEVCFTTSGGTPSRKVPKYFKGNIPWVKSGELDKGLILDTEENITDEAIKNSSAKIFPKGTLLIALYGATVGKLAFLGIDAATNQAVCGIYKSEFIDSIFLYHFLLLRKSKLVSQSIGGAQPNISQGILKDLDFPLPPLPEQHRIVSKIEQLFTDLDKGIDSLKTAQQQLKVYRQAVLKWAFEGKLLDKKNVDGVLPKGWVWETIEDITSVLGDGLHGTPQYSENGDYYFINGNNLSDWKIEIKENTKRVTKSEFEKYKKPLNDKTIFVSINGTLGNTAFYNNEKVILGKSACYFNVLDNIDKRYVKYCITSHRFVNYANINATGSTIKNVGLKAMREFEVPVPPTLAEQQLIVSEIESRLSVCDKIEEIIETSLLQAEALRLSILKKAFEGKLVKQNPTDEPASVLLERIKAERSTVVKNTQVQKKKKSNGKSN